VVSSSCVLFCRSDLHWSSSFLWSINNSVTYTIKFFFKELKKMLKWLVRHLARTNIRRTKIVPMLELYQVTRDGTAVIKW
jgi:hypothetical protein